MIVPLSTAKKPVGRYIATIVRFLRVCRGRYDMKQIWRVDDLFHVKLLRRAHDVIGDEARIHDRRSSPQAPRVGDLRIVDILIEDAGTELCLVRYQIRARTSAGRRTVNGVEAVG